MTGLTTIRATIAPRTRAHFLIAAAICVAAFAAGRAGAQTAPDYASLLAASDRSDADRDADKPAIRGRSLLLPRRVRA
jgi:hypothetical protein